MAEDSKAFYSDFYTQTDSMHFPNKFTYQSHDYEVEVLESYRIQTRRAQRQKNRV
jgi:hypothetical protein